MKLCILSDASSLHIVEWAQFFAQQGHDVSVISDNPADIAGATVHLIPKYEYTIHIPVISAAYQIIRKAIDIRHLLRTIQPDILHSHYANIYGYLASYTGFHPHILTCHGSDLLFHPERSRIEKYFIKRALHHADKITLPSEEMYRKAVEYGADPIKITKIQYGINIKEFPLTINKPKKIHLLSTRMLTTRYKTEIIIEAFSLIHNKYPGLFLEIVGDGPERSRLEQIVADKKIRKNVNFWGTVDHSQINKFYQQATVYITASPTDGLSISLLEAFASGVFPIIPDNQSNRNVLEMGFKVTLYQVNSPVDLAEKIIKVTENLPEIGPLIKTNRQLIEELFDRSKNLSRIETLYKDLIR